MPKIYRVYMKAKCKGQRDEDASPMAKTLSFFNDRGFPPDWADITLRNYQQIL